VNIRNQTEMSRIKILVIGERNIGKTTLCKKIHGMNNLAESFPTLGIDHQMSETNGTTFDTFDVPIDELKILANIKTSFNCVLLCFDLSRMETIKRLKSLMSLLISNYFPEAKYALVGLKFDILASLCPVEMKKSLSKAQKHSKKLNIPFHQISTLTNNIQDII